MLTLKILSVRTSGRSAHQADSIILLLILVGFLLQLLKKFGRYGHGRLAERPTGWRGAKAVFRRKMIGSWGAGLAFRERLPAAESVEAKPPYMEEEHDGTLNLEIHPAAAALRWLRADDDGDQNRKQQT